MSLFKHSTANISHMLQDSVVIIDGLTKVQLNIAESPIR